MLHVLTCKWQSGGTHRKPNPPEMEPRDFGWTQVAGKEMYPTSISDDVALAPDALLKVVKCG